MDCRLAQIERRDQHTPNGSFDVAALLITWIAGKRISDQDGFCVAREDCNAIPRSLSAPDSAIAGGADCIDRECVMRCLELLKANDVGLMLATPTGSAAACWHH